VVLFLQLNVLLNFMSFYV